MVEFFNDPINDYSVDHLTKVGETIIYWNAIQTVYMDIFCFLVDEKNSKIGNAIWLSLNNDTAQRDMTLAAAEARLGKGSKYLKTLTIINKCMTNLVAYRNGYAHTPIETLFSVTEGFQVVAHSRASKLTQAQRINSLSDEKEFRKFSNDLLNLYYYISKVHQSLISPSAKPLPRKPLLRLIPMPKSGGGRKNQRRKRKVPLSRRSSSS